MLFPPHDSKICFDWPHKKWLDDDRCKKSPVSRFGTSLHTEGMAVLVPQIREDLRYLREYHQHQWIPNDLSNGHHGNSCHINISKMTFAADFRSFRNRSHKTGLLCKANAGAMCWKLSWFQMNVCLCLPFHSSSMKLRGWSSFEIFWGWSYGQNTNMSSPTCQNNYIQRKSPMPCLRWSNHLQLILIILILHFEGVNKWNNMRPPSSQNNFVKNFALMLLPCNASRARRLCLCLVLLGEGNCILDFWSFYSGVST